ncbi:hypothetical protein I551_3435 [Mycobacterium ulcerans str. Harvey]|uniref:Uncharacterized protein n=1 Tax=Mycobacterium ulcerans str. Harvey TaxID=1299332 RepID=A0ABP3AHB6_MYCUL|nr:hypothetical protein I551_3435 [Mycobacterium ulcerans str. Harvey]
MPSGGGLHGLAQCGNLIKQAGEIVAADSQYLGRAGCRYCRRPQFPTAKRRFTDHFAGP